MKNNILTSHSVQKWSTIFGVFLIQLPVSLPWYWGNLSIYVNSYIVKYVDSHSEIVMAPWIICFTGISTCLGLFVAGFAYRKLGKKNMFLFGAGLAAIGLLGAYFTIQSSPIALSISIGFVFSIGRGIVVALSLCFAVDWSDGDVGLLTSIIEISFPFGAIIINQMTTLYTNPDNLVPDRIVGASNVFDQAEVVDKVPSVFFIMSLVMLGNTLVGFCLIRENKKCPVENRIDNPPSNVDINKLNDNNYGGTLSQNREDNSNVSSDMTIQSAVSLDLTDAPVDTDQFTIRQVLKSKTLYKLWLLALIGEVQYVLVTKYYKIFGQFYIKDDHFLTNVATSLLVAISLSRLCWGLSMDRWTMKTNYVLLFSSSAIMSFIFYFSPIVHKWFYTVVTLVFGSVANPIHILISVSCSKSFGKDEFILKFAIIFIPDLFINLVLPFIFRFFIETSGWFGLLTFNACINFVALLVSVFLLPQH